MRFTFFKNTFLLWLLLFFSCGSNTKDAKEDASEAIGVREAVTGDELLQKEIVTGADRFSEYLPLLKGKNVGIVANQTSIVLQDTGTVHLVDFLLSKKITLTKAFAPEHGFRGTADAGEAIKDGRDTSTGLPIISLYGKNKKPTQEQLQGIEFMVFDIQDVGVRFYTYISTLHYIMEACAEASIPLLILDRPNPNGHYTDGPILEPKHKSFLGMHPVPLVHGLTIGEYARMINGEGWLDNGMQCEIDVIPLLHYTHKTAYSLPVRPSPNLPNDVAIMLYPSLGLFEGTSMNAGRGTEMQFQVFGAPHLPKEKYPFSYVPQPNFGAKNPKHNGVECNGLDLRNTPGMDRVELGWILNAYRDHQKKNEFFNTANFTAHAGTEKLQQQIEQGLSAEAIRDSWKEGLARFQKTRVKYLLYE